MSWDLSAKLVCGREKGVFLNQIARAADILHMKFVISHLDEQSGPFDESELKAKWVTGDLLPIDYVYDETKEDWVLMSERFVWAKNNPATAAPPPLSEVTVRKKRPPEPPIVTKSQAIGAKVKLIDGVGEIDLSPLDPGEVELALQDGSTGLLKLNHPLKIHVKAAEPASVEWTFDAQNTVGQELEVRVQVLDRGGHICAHYNDQFVIRTSDQVHPEYPVDVQEGEATVRIQNTVSGPWTMSLKYSGTTKMELPADRTIEWQPGPASRLILDGPQEYVAGHPLKVQVKAVDVYGNLAKTFQGTVILEVKAS